MRKLREGEVVQGERVNKRDGVSEVGGSGSVFIGKGKRQKEGGRDSEKERG